MSQFSLATLAKIRGKLLDLTRRNRLLNYKESIRSIRIVDELPNETFQFLVSDEKILELLPLREKSETQLKLVDLDKKHDNKSFSDDNKISKNAELPLPNKIIAQKHRDTRLQTIFSDQVLERRCKKLRQESRTAIEETGCNLLHLAIGFLDWYEDDNSTEVNRAPLILVPITFRFVEFITTKEVHDQLSYKRK